MAGGFGQWLLIMASHNAFWCVCPRPCWFNLNGVNMWDGCGWGEQVAVVSQEKLIDDWLNYNIDSIMKDYVAASYWVGDNLSPKRNLGDFIIDEVDFCWGFGLFRFPKQICLAPFAHTPPSPPLHHHPTPPQLHPILSACRIMGNGRTNHTHIQLLNKTQTNKRINQCWIN